MFSSFWKFIQLKFWVFYLWCPLSLLPENLSYPTHKRIVNSKDLRRITFWRQRGFYYFLGTQYMLRSRYCFIINWNFLNRCQPTVRNIILLLIAKANPSLICDTSRLSWNVRPLLNNSLIQFCLGNSQISGAVKVKDPKIFVQPKITFSWALRFLNMQIYESL